MKTKKLDAVRVWKQFEDLLAPRLKFSVIDRAVYSHLLRHSRLEGKLRLQFSIQWVANNIGVSESPVRDAVRRLIDHGVLKLIERSKFGHVVEVRLPDEVPAARTGRIEPGGRENPPGGASLDDVDFLQNRELRQTIHARERGVCFYCLRAIPGRVQCLDHVTPRAKCGRNSYRNLVSCCLECNSRKGERPAGDYVRWLHAEGRLREWEFISRLRALKALAAGKLRPPFSSVPK
jgi:predicted transcriptional regulator